MQNIEECVNKIKEDLSTASQGTKLGAVVNRIVQFYVDNLEVSKEEVAIIMSDKDKTLLHFVCPEFLLNSGSIPIVSNDAIASVIFRSGNPIIENNLQHRKNLSIFQAIKVPEKGIQPLWKMIGAAIAVEGEKIGVIEISRRAPSFEESDRDFKASDLGFLETSIEKFAPILQDVLPVDFS